MTEADDIRRSEEEMRRLYSVAFERLSSILLIEDPVGINLVENIDEYAPEVGTILPRLRDCRSEDDVRRVVHEEFAKWFGTSTAGPTEKYQAVAKRVWQEVVPVLTK